MTMEITIILIKLFLLSWLITRFEPIQMLLDVLPDKLITNLFRLLLTCLKCVLLWTTLIYTGDIFIAAGMSFIGFFYDKFIGPIENKVRL